MKAEHRGAKDRMRRAQLEAKDPERAKATAALRVLRDPDATKKAKTAAQKVVDAWKTASLQRKAGNDEVTSAASP